MLGIPNKRSQVRAGWCHDYVSVLSIVCEKSGWEIWLLRDLLQLEEFRGQWPKWVWELQKGKLALSVVRQELPRRDLRFPGGCR